MKKLFFKLLAALYSSSVHRLERKIGYELKFSYIPKSWINGWMIFDMTKSWAEHNIKATGVNYFTVGNLVNGLSSRFIRTEKQYQSWLGAYLVKFEEDKEFTIQDHFNLAIADQMNWLRDFGDKNPFIKMQEQNVGKVESLTIGSYQGKLYEFLGGPSHSDVGEKSTNFHNCFEMHVMAEVINKSNPNLELEGSYFLPKDLSANYETLTLKGYIAIIELEKNVKFVLYGNAAALLNEQGQEIVDYCPLLKEDILFAFKSVVINKL
jgi:hypothetical protein